MTRSELMARVAARKSVIETEKADLVGQLSALQFKFDRLKSMASWAELGSGASIAVGVQVRYMLHVYECIAAHAKALTRRPTDTDYWKEVS